MPSYNKLMMIGNCTRDPELKDLNGGTVVANFSLASNRKYKTATGEEREDVVFIDCAAFGKQAETIGKWVRKGKVLFVEGRLKQEHWEDRQNGAKRSKLTMVVEGFQFLGPKTDEAEGNATEQALATPPAARPAPSQRQAGTWTKRPAVEKPFGDEEQFQEIDIPF